MMFSSWREWRRNLLSWLLSALQMKTNTVLYIQDPSVVLINFRLLESLADNERACSDWLPETFWSLSMPSQVKFVLRWKASPTQG